MRKEGRSRISCMVWNISDSLRCRRRLALLSLSSYKSCYLERSFGAATLYIVTVECEHAYYSLAFLLTM